MFLRLHQQKLQSSKVKNTSKSADKAKAEHLLLGLLFFLVAK